MVMFFVVVVVFANIYAFHLQILCQTVSTVPCYPRAAHCVLNVPYCKTWQTYQPIYSAMQTKKITWLSNLQSV